MSRRKIPEEEKSKIAKLCLSGEISIGDATRRAGISYVVVQEWIARYKEQGALTFRKQERNQVYSNERKLAAVSEYLQRGL